MDMVNIVDARMGEGKTAAALRLMKESPPKERFLYITNYPKEVEEVCKPFGYNDERDDHYLIIKYIKDAMNYGSNVAAPLKILMEFNGDLLSAARQRGYTLIIDGEFAPVTVLNLKPVDMSTILDNYAKVDQDGKVMWTESFYTGRLTPYRDLARLGALYIVEKYAYKVVPPSMFGWFKNVYVLMYKFDGSPLMAYLSRFDIKYKVIGITKDEKGPKIFDGVTDAPNIDFRKYIHIAGDPPITMWEQRLNEKFTAESIYAEHIIVKCCKKNKYIDKICNDFYNFVRRYGREKYGILLWTTYKGCDKKLLKCNPYPYHVDNFIPLYEEDYGDWTDSRILAFLATISAGRAMIKFYRDYKKRINNNRQALIHLLNFIWKSAIRHGKPVILFAPSATERGLLKQWMIQQAGCTAQEPWLGMYEWVPEARVAYFPAAKRYHTLPYDVIGYDQYGNPKEKGLPSLKPIGK